MKKELNQKKLAKLPPIHPGEILREELLIPRNISPQELAQALKVPKEQIQWICEERGDITPDLATRLSIYFDSSVEFWLNIQRSYDKEIAEEKLSLLKKEIKPYKENREGARLNH
ncbi:HigA family addiction module antitoxin [endosymbiont GvMRE of Glomus versiforme]|uniref:HigA family addiction module antitoxin n=1 Tax=endosymbiont GvMRE of Glomus versiforme TaxID=2039283 RepID=UPI000EB8F763|nr:HigA family addiction module antitoxin [endosymbiont GvMRE of Glomus versiforme]RHZ35946.1 Addiction module antidote protein, HigA family [endosymbiont GvMRE of Glomus versiforme]